MKPRVIFFDIGQTLVTGADRSPRRLFASRLDLSEKEAKQVGRLIMTHPSTDPSSLATELQALLPNHDPHYIRSVVESLWEEQSGSAKEIPGATSLFRFLKSSGIRLGVISNIWHPFYLSFCRSCPEIASLVDYAILSYRMEVKKPSPVLYRRALEMSGEPAASCWMVGDTYELDMEPAARLGMRTLWVLCRPEKERTLLVEILRDERSKPSWVVENLNEAFPFFQKTMNGSC